MPLVIEDDKAKIYPGAIRFVKVISGIGALGVFVVLAFAVITNPSTLLYFLPSLAVTLLIAWAVLSELMHNYWFSRDGSGVFEIVRPKFVLLWFVGHETLHIHSKLTRIDMKHAFETAANKDLDWWYPIFVFENGRQFIASPYSNGNIMPFFPGVVAEWSSLKPKEIEQMRDFFGLKK